MTDEEDPNLEKELYYLIAKFLENGPCKNAAKVLRREIEENKFVIPRKDWEGSNHDQNLVAYDERNNHIPANFLGLLAKKINPLIEKCEPSFVRSIKSLLSTGNRLLLSNEKSATLFSHSTAEQAACFNSAPKLPSINTNSLPITSVLNGRSYNGIPRHLQVVCYCDVYRKLCMHKRILGHLASVYCVLFDQTGSIIVTGADDNLLKVWSAVDGRLIATFRGHSGQITDITINKENTLIASGSLDKTIRVWSLQDTCPIAVLQGHTGMITSLQFCPSAHEDIRYLMSTGGDGHVCFWLWSLATNEFNLTPIKFNEKSRPGAQMLCSSFSSGGCFLASGSSDNYVRVYQLYPDGPEKIAELANHADHVDSILYNNGGDRFLTGSRDGTAMVWNYVQGEWQAKCLDASQRIHDDPKLIEDVESKIKLKVTMICWSKNDYYIITAGTDYVLRVWNSFTCKFIHALKGHTDEVYILEAHPIEPNLLLSAGHDGNLILWDIERRRKIKLFFNLLEGQGHGSIFDCKFSPNGLQFVATDSHGHLIIFGFGSDELYQRVPYEQFFHTDYRPIIRDANNYVLDEQTQTAPHLMAPPFLVDIDGNPYPSDYQLLIPGRNSQNLPQLRVDEPENLPPLLAEIAAAEAAERNLRSPRSRQASVQEAGLLSPGGMGGVGLRESGDVEGVRQQNNLYVSGDITDADAEAWRNRTIIPTNNLYNPSEDEQSRREKGIEEYSNFLNEAKKMSRKLSESHSSDATKNFLRSVGRGRGRGRTRQAKVRQPPTYVRASALQAVNISQPSGREVINVDQNIVSSDSEPEDWQGESSDSTDDSDWVHETKSSRESGKKKKSRRKNVASSSDVEAGQNENDENDDTEDIDVENSSSDDSDEETSKSSNRRNNDDRESSDSGADEGEETSRKGTRSRQGKQRAEEVSQPVKKKAPQKKLKKEIKSERPVPSVDNLDEYLQFYHPPQWLLSVESQKFPYFPQIGDEVYYLRQGHHLYVQEVIKQNEYDIQEGRQAYRRYDLSPAELCKLVGISYDVGPPKMCSLKLELIGKKKSTGEKKTITVRFHDMPHVVDFLVLKHLYEQSLQQEWDKDDRFRCIIDDSWYYGTIAEVSPSNEEFPTSPFLSLVVKWDSGDDERLSPWDLERITDEDVELVDNTPLVEGDKVLFKYPTNENDWPYEDEEQFCERVSKGLEDFSALEIASSFAYPVDVQQYPTYWRWIAFPTDLETIRQRVRNQFYRRIDAVLWEIRQLITNASKFNEKGSSIVLDAAYVVKVLCKFIKDATISDIITLYNEMDQAEEIKAKPVYDDQESEEEEEEEIEEEDEETLMENMANGCTGSSVGASSSGSARNSSQSWIAQAKTLLEFINSKDDAQPFREPVNLVDFPEYLETVREPMDISTIRHRLDANQYDNAEAFIRDFQLIFKNSKSYNTDRRSLIYKMTLRLSSLFEARCESIRQAYAEENAVIHWTRRRTRNQCSNSQATCDNETKPSSGKLRFLIKKETNGNYSGEESRSPANSKITLSEFVKRPTTRSHRGSTAEENSRPSRNARTRLKLKSETASSGSESDLESDDDVGTKNVNSHNEVPNSPLKSRRSIRVTNKRRRYGFESDEEDNSNNNKNKKIKTEPEVRRKGKTTPARGRGVTLKKRALTDQRSSRKRKNVNYCEDDLDQYDMFDENNAQQSADEPNEDSSSNDSESSSEEEEEQEMENTYIAGVSSRGRVRRAASRFSDFVEK